ncbi:hypothetical protein HWN40_02655 [Methanolobus zinderi]|uniref:PKD domain-containing protein n=1 Tax=Methanolobus zinderi TaxID=536044 RepID=A0A7D5EFJ1_9EURY|nr:PKD domain-containing protein [Methanolobus zinderi]QLC49240.1 hypothetical protein HWN40_02655 [Methanolobus zinderi]
MLSIFNPVFIASAAASEPVILDNSTGDSWILHTWESDSGDIADSYNISHDGSWINDSISEFNDTGLLAHEWSNITVYAYNATTSTLSSGVADNVQLPNNPIYITDVDTPVTIKEGETVTVDINSTDSDGDSGTFTCNRTDLFDDFNPTSGEGSWTSNYTANGTYYVEFSVSDGYGSSDSEVMEITVTNVNVPPEFEEIDNQTVKVDENL